MTAALPDRHDRVAAAYAGGAEGAAALCPALKLLRRALPLASWSLLWPQGVELPADPSARWSARIEYPVRGADPATLESCIRRLRDRQAARIVVFTQSGWTAEIPACIAYLAEIPIRFGLAAEFAGGVLSDALSPPESSSDRERHLHLAARALDAIRADASCATPAPVTVEEADTCGH